MKKKNYLHPEIETTVFTYEHLMFIFSGNASDSDDSDNFFDNDFGFGG